MIAFQCFDMALVFIVGYLIHLIRFGENLPNQNYQLFLIVLALLTFNIFNALSVYSIFRGESLNKELTRITIAWISVILIASALTFLSKTGAQYSRLWAGWTFLTTFFCLIISRVILYTVISNLRVKGYNQKNIAIIGAGSLGKRACDSLHRTPWVGIKPVAFFDDDESTQGLIHKGVKVVGSTSQLIEYIEHQRVSLTDNAIDQVWIALPLSSAEKITQLQNELQNTAAKVFLVPDVYAFNLANNQVNEIAGLPLLNMSAPPISGLNSSIKRLEDIIISSILLTVLAPLFLILGVLIKSESPGPVFFKQRRYGEDGKEFLVWKFRSMTVTEDGNEVKQAQRNDERITKIGAWIRKLSIDELPQLINVLLGNMSLVGPRPHAVAHNEYYRNVVPGYMARHQIKPGITGLAQVKGHRGETPNIEDMEQRIYYDLEYIRNWTVFLDFRILAMTLPALMKNKDTY